MFLENYVESMQILNSVLPTAKSNFGTQHNLTIDILGTLANTSSRSGDPGKAIHIYDEIIPTAERVFGEDSPTVLTYKCSKALALGKLGRLDESLSLLHYVHEKRVTIFGANDVRALRAKNAIGFVHNEKMEFSKALEVWEQVEEGFKHMLGENHPYTMNVQKQIGRASCRERV